MPQTAEQEERALLIESERQTARNMCHGLFRNSKTAVRSDSFWKQSSYLCVVCRACDIPFQGWSSSQIVSLMLEDVVNKVSFHVSYLRRSVMLLVGCTDHQEVHQRGHQAVASRQVQTKDGPQNREGRVFWGHGKSNLCCSGIEWVWNGKMILECFIFVTSAWVNYYT